MVNTYALDKVALQAAGGVLTVIGMKIDSKQNSRVSTEKAIGGLIGSTAVWIASGGKIGNKAPVKNGIFPGGKNVNKTIELMSSGAVITNASLLFALDPNDL